MITPTKKYGIYELSKLSLVEIEDILNLLIIENNKLKTVLKSYNTKEKISFPLPGQISFFESEAK